MNRTKSKMIRRQNLIANLYILPIFLNFTIFLAIPLLLSAIYSFTIYNPIKHDNFFGSLSEIWVGLRQYRELFTNLAYSKSFRNAWINTLAFLLEVPVSLIVGLLLAWAINSKLIKGGKVFKMLFYVPVVSSVVASNLVWRYIFDHDYGIINSLLNNHSIYWLRDPVLIKVAIVIKDVWARTGACLILISATMQTIDVSLYEAADLDGAGSLRKFLRITVPLLKPVAFYLVVTGIMGAMKNYSNSLIFAQGAYEAQSVVYFIWEKGIKSYNYGIASAASIILTLVILVFTVIQFKFSKQGKVDDGER